MTNSQLFFMNECLVSAVRLIILTLHLHLVRLSLWSPFSYLTLFSLKFGPEIYNIVETVVFSPSVSFLHLPDRFIERVFPFHPFLPCPSHLVHVDLLRIFHPVWSGKRWPGASNIKWRLKKYIHGYIGNSESPIKDECDVQINNSIQRMGIFCCKCIKVNHHENCFGIQETIQKLNKVSVDVCRFDSFS